MYTQRNVKTLGNWYEKDRNLASDFFFSLDNKKFSQLLLCNSLHITQHALFP